MRLNRWLAAAFVQTHTSLTPQDLRMELRVILGARLEGNSLLWWLPAPPHRVSYVEKRERQTCKARTTPDRLCFLSFVLGLSSRGQHMGALAQQGYLLL